MGSLRAGATGKFSGPFWRLPMIVVLVGIAAGAGVLFYTQGRSRDVAIANATAAAKPWELVGAPCAEGFSGPWTNPEYAPKRSLVFNGVRFARRVGHVDCSAVASGKGEGADYIPLCQFSGPILLEVITERGTFRYQPGVGHPASVSVVDGQPRCVLAANVQF